MASITRLKSVWCRTHATNEHYAYRTKMSQAKARPNKLDRIQKDGFKEWCSHFRVTMLLSLAKKENKAHFVFYKVCFKREMLWVFSPKER